MNNIKTTYAFTMYFIFKTVLTQGPFTHLFSSSFYLCVLGLLSHEYITFMECRHLAYHCSPPQRDLHYIPGMLLISFMHSLEIKPMTLSLQAPCSTDCDVLNVTEGRQIFAIPFPCLTWHCDWLWDLGALCSRTCSKG